MVHCTVYALKKGKWISDQCTWSMCRCKLCLRFLLLVTTASRPFAAADASTWASLDPFICFPACLRANTYPPSKSCGKRARYVQDPLPLCFQDAVAATESAAMIISTASVIKQAQLSYTACHSEVQAFISPWAGLTGCTQHLWLPTHLRGQ